MNKILPTLSTNSKKFLKFILDTTHLVPLILEQRSPTVKKWYSYEREYRTPRVHTWPETSPGPWDSGRYRNTAPYSCTQTRCKIRCCSKILPPAARRRRILWWRSKFSGRKMKTARRSTRTCTRGTFACTLFRKNSWPPQPAERRTKRSFWDNSEIRRGLRSRTRWSTRAVFSASSEETLKSIDWQFAYDEIFYCVELLGNTKFCLITQFYFERVCFLINRRYIVDLKARISLKSYFNFLRL